jgi:multiple sugar transport system permease protein
MSMRPSDRYPIAWILPAMLPVLLFTLYPIADAFYTSLHQVIVILPGRPFIGFENYRQLILSPDFRETLGNTIAFAAVTAPLVIILGYGVACLLLARFRGRALLRAVVILPWVLPGAIAAVVWMWILHPSWGILNLVLYESGAINRYIPWLTDPRLARLCVVVAFVWTQFPFASILIIAGLSAIDGTLYDAALVDGANAWQRFRYITFPGIKPVLMVLAVYQSLVALTSYDLAYALTAGGPGTATTLLSFEIWKESFSMMNFGSGSAVGFILVVLSLAFMIAIMKALPTAIIGRG